VFLTPEQLEDLTGLIQPHAQARWLAKNEIEHYVRVDGKVRVPNPIRKIGGVPQVSANPRFEAVQVRR
jgi:hypothetical protein